MEKRWVNRKLRTMWWFLAAGGVLFLAGVLAQWLWSGLPYNFRILSGLGIVLLGLGIGQLVIYRRVVNDQDAARRLNIEERDERSLLIRARAGHRAFWVAMAFTYSGLMWASFAENGDLPALSGDTLWFFLAAAAVIPFGVYILGLVIENRNG